jgi:hypothetical protein
MGKEIQSIEESVDWFIWEKLKKFYGVTVEGTEIFKGYNGKSNNITTY